MAEPPLATGVGEEGVDGGGWGVMRPQRVVGGGRPHPPRPPPPLFFLNDNDGGGRSTPWQGGGDRGGGTACNPGCPLSLLGRARPPARATVDERPTPSPSPRPHVRRWCGAAAATKARRRLVGRRANGRAGPHGRVGGRFCGALPSLPRS